MRPTSSASITTPTPARYFHTRSPRNEVEQQRVNAKIAFHVVLLDDRSVPRDLVNDINNKMDALAPPATKAARSLATSQPFHSGPAKEPVFVENLKKVFHKTLQERYFVPQEIADSITAKMDALEAQERSAPRAARNQKVQAQNHSKRADAILTLIKAYIASDVLEELPPDAGIDQLEDTLISQVWPEKTPENEDFRQKLGRLLGWTREEPASVESYEFVLRFLVEPMLHCRMRDEKLSTRPFGGVPTSELPPAKFCDEATFWKVAGRIPSTGLTTEYPFKHCQQKYLAELYEGSRRIENMQLAAEHNKQCLDMFIDVLAWSTGVSKSQVISEYEMALNIPLSGTCESAVEEAMHSGFWINRKNPAFVCRTDVLSRLEEDGHDVTNLTEAMKTAGGNWTFKDFQTIHAAWKAVPDEVLLKAHAPRSLNVEAELEDNDFL